MANVFLFANNAASTLAGALTTSSTTCQLAAGGGAAFPSPGAGQQFALTFIDAATGLLNEIVYCTARTSDTLTIVRGQEGTDALNWAANDLANALVTAGQMAAMLQQGESASVYTGVDSGSANAYVVTTTSPAFPASLATGLLIQFTVTNPNTGASTLNAGGLGVESLVDANGSALVNGALVTGTTVLASWNGTEWQVLSATPGSASVAVVTAVAQGRLTLTSGVPVLNATVSGATSVYYTPYSGSSLPIWNGTKFSPATFSEVSQALSDTTKSPAAAAASSVYDVFGWMDGMTFRATRGPAWTSTTARGTGAGTTQLARSNGVLVNEYSISNGPAAGYGTYLGTFATNSSTTVDFIFGVSTAGGGASRLMMWNAYNRVDVGTMVQDPNSWDYATTGTWQAADTSANNSVTFVLGLQEDQVSARFTFNSYFPLGSSGNTVKLGIGLDSTTAPAVAVNNQSDAFNNATWAGNQWAHWTGTVLGEHVLTGLQNVLNTTSSSSNGLLIAELRM